MKSLMNRFVLAALVAVACSGCGDMTARLAAELIDIAGEPDTLYHSGRDLLSGDYEIVGRPGSRYDKSEPLALRFDEKGWKMSEDGEAGLHIYEMTPHDTAGWLSHYNENTMQCAGSVKVTDFKICAAPKGTRIRYQHVNEVMETGYIVIYEGAWNHAVKK